MQILIADSNCKKKKVTGVGKLTRPVTYIGDV
jgi:hypothetical protein